MKTKETSKANATATVLTAKVIADLRKKALNQRDSFKTACTIFLEAATTDSTFKKVCQYLGLSAESMKSKNISETRKSILAKLPIYHMIEGSDTHFPARLRKVNAASGINGYIAVADTYINALLSLAKILSEGNSYDIRRVDLTTAAIDEAAQEYTEESVSLALYDKVGAPIDADKAKYIAYLNKNRRGSEIGREAKAAFMAK